MAKATNEQFVLLLHNVSRILFVESLGGKTVSESKKLEECLILVDEYLSKHSSYATDGTLNEVQFFLKQQSEPAAIFSALFLSKVVDNEKFPMALVMEFVTRLLEITRCLRRKDHVDFVAGLFNKMIDQFGDGIVDSIEVQCRDLMHDLFATHPPPVQRYADYALLNRIMRRKQYLIWKEMKKFEASVIFERAVAETGTIEAEAFSFVSEAMRFISKNVEKEEQRHYFAHLAMSLISHSKDQKSATFFALFCFAYGCIFRYLDKSFFMRDQLTRVFETTIENVRQAFAQNDSRVNRLACQMLPEMVAFNPPLFLEHKLLWVFLDMLYDQVDIKQAGRLSFYNSVYGDLTQVLRHFAPEVVQPQLKRFGDKIMDLFVLNFDQLRNGPECEVGHVLEFFKMAFKSPAEILAFSQIKLSGFVNILLVQFFDINSISVLELLRQHPNRSFVDKLNQKLKRAIANILQKDDAFFDDLDNDWDTNSLHANEVDEFSEADAQAIPVNLKEAHPERRKSVGIREGKMADRAKKEKYQASKFRKDFSGRDRTDQNRSPDQAKPVSAFNLQFKSFRADQSVLTKLRTERFGSGSFNPADPKHQEKRIVVALEALARFEFKSRSTLKRKEFITNTVFEYLYSQSVELRRCAARIVFVLISDSDSTRHSEAMLSDESIQSLIKTIISIAVGDPDDQVRVEVLTALNTRMESRFFPFVLKEETLKNLLAMASDENYKIQKHSILLLEKLVPSFPELMSRFDLMVFLASSYLLTNKLNGGSKTLNYIKMLKIIAQNSQFLLKHRLPVLVPILVANLEDCFQGLLASDHSHQNGVFAKQLLKCLGHMLEFQPELSRAHFDPLAHLLMPALAQLDEELQSQTLGFCCTLIRNSGYQLLAVVRYDILEVLLRLLDNSVCQALRINALKLLGTIGAVDPLIVKKLKAMSEKLQVSGQTDHSNTARVIQQVRKQPFNFERHWASHPVGAHNDFSQQFEQLLGRVRSFQKDQSSLPGPSADPQPRHPKSPGQPSSADQIKKAIKRKIERDCQTAEDFTEKVQNEDYLLMYVTHSTLKVLLSTVHSSADESLVAESLESVQQIVLTLSYHVFSFRAFLFGGLLQAFKRRPSRPIQSLVVENLKYFAKASVSKLKSDPRMVSRLIKFLLRNLDDKRLQPDLFAICRLLVDNKASFPHQFKDIVLRFMSLLKSETRAETVREIFELVIGLNQRDYLYLVTPSVLELFPRKNKDRECPGIVTQALAYFRNVMHTKHFENYLGSIIRAFTALLQDYPQFSGEVRPFLMEIFKTSGEKCFNYLFLMNPYLKDMEEFQKISRTLNEKGYIETEVRHWPDGPDGQKGRVLDNKDQPTGPDPDDNQAMAEVEEMSLKSFSKRRLNFEAFRGLFVANNFNKSDFDWNDWLTKLKSELVCHSPSTVLIACKNLRMQKGVMDDLFKPAFVMFWAELTDHQRSQVTRSLDTIISSRSKIQLSFRKAILEVLEFMSQKNAFGIPLNVAKMAEFAIHCNSPSTAIYFKELEFQKSPRNAFEVLLNLYCELGFLYTAEGLIDYVQNELKLRVEEEVVHMRGKWDFLPSATGEGSREAEHMQIFGNVTSSNWDLVLQKIREVTGGLGGKPLSAQLANYNAFAAFHLGRWEDLKRHVNEVQIEKDFYKAILLANDGHLEGALDCLEEEWRGRERTSQGMASYNSNYKKFVKLQKLSETQETFRLQLHLERLCRNELYNYLVPLAEQQADRSACHRHALEVWEDKLFSMERDIDYWQEVLAARNLLFTKREMLTSYLKLWNICLHSDNPQLFTKILTTLKKETGALEVSDPLLELTEIECNFRTGKIQQKQIIGKIEELFAKKSMPKQHVSMFYKKVGVWVLMAEKSADPKDEKVIKFFERFLGDVKDDSCLWHFFAIANYQVVKRLDREDFNSPAGLKFLLNSFQGFANSLAHEPRFNAKYTMQDLLRFLELWYQFHELKNGAIQEAIEKCIQLVPANDWVLILRQILARLEQESNFSNSAKNLLLTLVRNFPQYLVFPLLLAKRSKHEMKFRMIAKVLRTLEETNKTLVHQATLFSEQLIRISFLLDEIWVATVSELRSKANSNIDEVVDDLNYLIDLTSSHKGRSSHSEVFFFQRFGSETSQAREYLDLYETTRNELFFLHAWNICLSIAQELEALRRTETDDLLYLERVSPELHQLKDTQLCVPGTLNLNPLKNKNVYVAQMHPVLRVLRSKRRPRKVTLFGNNLKEYSFLLKGSEDLRLDERVMQLLNMTNDLLKPILDVHNQSIKISTFNVLPLSFDCGIISWLEGWDTMFEAIKNHRLKTQVKVDCERDLWRDFHENYNVLLKTKKLEVFRFVCSNTKAEDLKSIFWLRSPSADVWLTMRNNYICSLAVMSIVGFILGLGDRHLMNIMLERNTGKIVHIDFGECFDSEQLRDKYPEKVPFRLTRMLVNAMEACGIEGTFKRVAEMVMNILRLNKEVYLAFFEEFICDPLITWQKVRKRASIEPEEDLRSRQSNPDDDSHKIDISIGKDNQEAQNELEQWRNSVHNGDQMPSKSNIRFNDFTNQQNLNSRAIQALRSIVNKLNGKDFDNTEIDHKAQVRKLIAQATNPENISQAFSGWNPFW
jgi:hypothetical protein